MVSSLQRAPSISETARELLRILEGAPVAAQVYHVEGARLVLAGSNERARKLLGLDSATPDDAELGSVFPTPSRAILVDRCRDVALHGVTWQDARLELSQDDDRPTRHVELHARQVAPGEVMIVFAPSTVPPLTRDLAARLDLEGRHLWASGSLLAMLGVDAEHIRERTHRDLGFSHETCRQHENLIRAVTTSGDACSAQVHLDTPGGRLHLHARCEPEHGPDRQITSVLLTLRGLTEQEEQQRLLRESEERYRALVQSLPIAVAVHVAGAVVYVNPEAVRTVAAPSADALLGRPIMDFVHPDDRELVRRRVADVYRTGTQGDLVEERFLRHDGASIDVEVLVAPVTYEGQPAGQVVFRDISHRKQSEAALRESETRYRELIETMPDGIVVVRGRSISFANAAAARLLGARAPEDLLGLSPMRFFAPTSRASIRARWRDTVRRNEPSSLAEAQLVRLDGKHRTVEGVGLPVRHRGRAALQLVFRDITARRRAEGDRDRLFALSADMLCVAGFDGLFRQVNPAWTATLGWDRETLLSTPWIDFVHPDDRALTLQHGEELLAGKPVHLFTNRYRCADGSYRWLSWNSVPIPDEHIIFAVVRDITERRQLEEQLRLSEKLTALGQLAGGVAHDFNNQLAGILGYAELLKRRTSSDPKIGQYAEKISNAAQRSAQLTQQLLAFARKGKYQVTRVDLHKILEEVVSLLSHSLDKRIRIRERLSARALAVEGDPAQLQNALLNLAINARDAMPEGGTLAIETDVVELEERRGAELHPGAYARVRVHDTGVGMSAETLRRAFEPFFTTKELGRGTGLGLSAVYGIVRNHQGAVDIESVPGAGTRVAVLLPLSPSAGHTEAPAPADVATPASLHVLVVDDEDVVRSTLTEMLLMLGHHATACATPQEALTTFQRRWKEIHLVILDLIMPDLPGHRALERMRAIDPSVRVVLTSGHSLDGATLPTSARGRLVPLQKPFTQQMLALAIARAMDSADV